MLEELRQRVCSVNLALKQSGLVIQTWGNASAVDRESGLICIKPSGIDYARMQPEHMVITDLSGAVVEGTLRPSVDLPSHLALYRAFEEIGGVVHTHSHYATCFAQARREIPCLGTTHADYFNGNIPLVPPPNAQEVNEAYEHHTGMAIVRQFADIGPMNCPAALVAGHGPFAWGSTVESALENAAVLEELARMALHTLALTPGASPLEDILLTRHFERKHGARAYYGQRGTPRG